MRRLAWLILIVVAISSLAGCSRAKRIANDLDWVVLDGEPSREN
ncbi:MAG: hypothetical protein WC569_02415 [Candidatus Omnitrophota bacterium]